MPDYNLGAIEKKNIFSKKQKNGKKKKKAISKDGMQADKKETE